MGRYLFAMFLALVAVACIYIGTQHDTTMPMSIGLQIDNQESAESRRLKTINNLLISEANKKDIRQGRLYWGAPAHIIELAFNASADSVTIRQVDDRQAVFQHFSASPMGAVTVELHDNSLACVHDLNQKKSQCSQGESSIYPRYPF